MVLRLGIRDLAEEGDSWDKILLVLVSVSFPNRALIENSRTNGMAFDVSASV